VAGTEKYRGVERMHRPVKQPFNKGAKEDKQKRKNERGYPTADGKASLKVCMEEKKKEGG